MAELQPNIDNKTIFTRLWDISGELRQKLEARFELHPDPSTATLKAYSSAISEARGSLNAFSGPEIDWLVHTWMYNPKTGVGALGLTIWLGPHIQTPHLIFEFGTTPEILFNMDYISRSDLSTDLEYLDRYYEPVNPIYLSLQADLRLSPYISQVLYVRQFQSPTNLCYTCSATEDSLELIRTIAHEMLDRWLVWVNEAEPLPEEAQATLVKRDLFVRRTAFERDPGSKWLMQMFGQELTDTLVRALWGGDSPMAQLH
ncbi:MAG: hypothetical protein QNJ46_29300 [Leptolyngbyaceae cyanobacterium MO_188.B28]|nr:hypothetical protein [Leptolyngbyaceae cyanobacterium MO_188.B28]